MTRGYQRDFSKLHPESMYDAQARERKAQTMLAVLRDRLGSRLESCALLDVGASTGFIDNSLAGHVGTIVGIDIDESAIASAGKRFPRENLTYQVADAMALPFTNACFDVVICAQVYEHVPDASRLLAEIHRVLKPGGICYFAADNRLVLVEHDNHLPLLSLVPRPLAHIYMRLAGRGRYYHEMHLSCWGLRRLTNAFEVTDYTRRLVFEPAEFLTEYMLPPGRLKTRVARLIAKYALWLFPTFIWVLRKAV